MISEIKALPRIRLGLLLLRFALGFGSLAHNGKPACACPPVCRAGTGRHADRRGIWLKSYSFKPFEFLDGSGYSGYFITNV